jgi:hypothetical protein
MDKVRGAGIGLSIIFLILFLLPSALSPIVFLIYDFPFFVAILLLFAPRSKKQEAMILSSLGVYNLGLGVWNLLQPTPPCAPYTNSNTPCVDTVRIFYGLFQVLGEFQTLAGLLFLGLGIAILVYLRRTTTPKEAPN